MVSHAVSIFKPSPHTHEKEQSPPPPNRQVTQLERNMNILVIIQFATLFLLSGLCAGLNQWWEIRYGPVGESA